MKNVILSAGLSLFLSCAALGQADIITPDPIGNDLHRNNIGVVTFMAKPIGLPEYKETDFLKRFEFPGAGDLNIRVFMANSLTNYLHRLAPAMTAEDLVSKGNYQFSFFVDGKLIYKENLNSRAGTAVSKNKSTVFRVPLMSTTQEDSWGRFLWNRFMMNDGEESLTAGDRVLRIEIRPYIRDGDVKVGDLIAKGELTLSVVKTKIDEKLAEIQTIQPGTDWTISRDNYDREKIREMNRKIAENIYKDLTSIVVIKDGKLLIEEYFNGATRATLHNTRSVGKSFSSTLTGIAIADGHLKSESQTLSEFYDLRKFANFSQPKNEVALKHLLTMSSAFDGFDFVNESPGNEEKMYPTADWVKFALDLPIDPTKTSGGQWRYFTAGVIVLGDILNRSVPGGLESYADKKLFAPMGITKYTWQYTPQNVVNTAGGIQLSSLDLAKFGQLYKNGGTWNGKRILDASWVDRTFSRQIALPDNKDEFYGYLFWNKTYKVNAAAYETYYATGNGGNKIFVFKDKPFVVIITATAFGKPYMHLQADKLMERYILPAVEGK